MSRRMLVRVALAFAVILSAVLVGANALPLGGQKVAGPYVVDAAPLSAPTWISGVQVQNLDTVNSADIFITYYNRDGSVNASQGDKIPAGTSKTYFASTMAASSGFAGSAVVSSNRPVAAIVNQLTSGPVMGEAYDGISAPATQVYLPLIMRNNSGYNTTIHVQNAGQADATNVKLLFRGPTNYDYTLADSTHPLKAGAAVAVPQDTMTQLGSGRWVGSVTITSDQQMAAAVNESNNSQLLSYSGVNTGGSKVYAPLLMANNSGWWTGFQVMNIGSSAATVNLKINGTQTDSAVILPGAAKTWFPIPGMPGKIAAGTAEGATGTEQLVGIVNEVGASGQGMAYNAFTGGTSKIFAPLLMSNNSGWWTGFQVMNIGTSPATVNLKVNGTQTDSTVIAPGTLKVWFPVPGMPSKIASGVAEGATGTEQLVGIVNEISSASGDNAMSYEAINQ